MINFIKGIFVGIFNIVPGLSGSVLLVVLNLYDKCIKAISTIFKKPKENILFLLPIGLGIIIGTFIFSKIIFYFINNYKSPTYIVFTGFILGTIPSLIKEAKKEGFKLKHLIPFFITFILGIILLFMKTDITSHSDYNLMSYLLIGILLSLSTIIPGISSTLLLSLFGIYEIYISSISSLNLYILILIFISFIITSYFIAKIINYFINNYYSYTYFAILGFSLSTIPSLIIFNINYNNLISSIILGIIAFILTIYIFKVMK